MLIVYFALLSHITPDTPKGHVIYIHIDTYMGGSLDPGPFLGPFV